MNGIIRHTARARTFLLASSILVPALALGGLATEAQAQDEVELSVPQLTSCSERYSLISSMQPELRQDAREAIRRGFDTRRDWGTDENIEIMRRDTTARGEPVVRVHYPEGTSSPGDTEPGGAGFYTEHTELAGADSACLRYQVRFAPDFDFVRGGKLPGLYGGEAPSGGDRATGENGFSMRFMWREDGDGELYEYVVNQDEEYGASVGRGLWRFETGRWVTIEQEIVLNDPDRKNGVARVWIDGEPILEQQGIVYRTTDSLHIDGVMFSTFFGGHGEEWRTPYDQSVDFAGFRLYAPSS
ncbi:MULTISPECIES: polysaccharide lyase [Halomonadaceae]|uniref:polysaccharide lyase n=1 Tax=Halomonadaceae TaxID=28256 RepID=UPI00159A93A9|nr:MULTISPECIES: hypothetical protein [Halomonas]QJQ95278.1 hypothetical protein HIO72_08340 [Halomonas sp. PA5]